MLSPEATSRATLSQFLPKGIRMTDAAPPADPTPHPRRELRAQRRRAREAERPPGERLARIGVGHRVFLHEHGEPFFGPGVFDLLVLVEASGSLRKAA
jgi:hypothetical protein